jgi:hypothetical protein
MAGKQDGKLERRRDVPFIKITRLGLNRFDWVSGFDPRITLIYGNFLWDEGDVIRWTIPFLDKKNNTTRFDLVGFTLIGLE